MESSSWDYLILLLVRPVLALLFTLSLIFTGWLLAWKLVLVHVPLVQEIFGLRKKPVKPKPARRRRFTQFYNRMNAQNSSMSLQEKEVAVEDGTARANAEITSEHSDGHKDKFRRQSRSFSNIHIQ